MIASVGMIVSNSERMRPYVRLKVNAGESLSARPKVRVIILHQVMLPIKLSTQFQFALDSRVSSRWFRAES